MTKSAKPTKPPTQPHPSPWYPDWLAWAGERTWCAIDFETFDAGRDSACSVAMVRVEHGKIVTTVHALCRPPRSSEDNTHIHGIRWRDVANRPQLREIWEGRSFAELLHGCAYFVAHNVGFDKSVLSTTLEAQGGTAPDLPWYDTVHLAKAVWPEWKDHVVLVQTRSGTRQIPPGYRLDLIADRLAFSLRHHDALSDSTACVSIVQAARALCRDQLGDFHDDWRAKAITRLTRGEPQPLVTDHLTTSVEGCLVTLHCDLCGHDGRYVEPPGRLGSAVDQFARAHQPGQCPRKEDKALRDQHYQELGSLCAPALEQAAEPKLAKVIPLPVRHAAPLAKAAIPAVAEASVVQTSLFATTNEDR